MLTAGHVDPPRLFTIGYEGKKVEAYIEQLRNAGATVLCDVRCNAISRKPGFSKKKLAEVCARVEIRYEHFPSLGIPTAERQAVRSAEDRARLFERYTRQTLVQERPLLKKLSSCMSERGERWALTCFEANPEECHRHCVANALSALGVGPAVHL